VTTKPMIRSLCIAVCVLLVYTVPMKAQRGPVTPESCQFEPVDATDLVSLYTGNFTYNVPLLEVPGPEGNWPINMFYHAGVGPNTEASWIGLGWDINPGAINRFMNGYPDDYWGGNVQSHWWAEKQSGNGVNFGINYGPVGLDYNYDSYTGQTGINASYNLLAAPLKMLNLGGLTFLAPYANLKIVAGTSGVGISVGMGFRLLDCNSHMGASLGINTTVTTKGGSQSVGLSLIGWDVGDRGINSADLMGVSFSTNNSHADFSFAGVGMQSQSSCDSKGHYSSSSSGIDLPIGLLFGDPFFSISLGYYEWEWWLDEYASETAVGSIHQLAYNGKSMGYIWGNSTEYNSIDDAVKYSESINYASLQASTTNSLSSPRIDRSLISDAAVKNIFSAEDLYEVDAQGIAGSFQPYFEYSYQLWDEDGSHKTGKYGLNGSEENTGGHVKFRFNGDPGGAFTSLHSGEGTDYATRLSNKGSKKIRPAIDRQTGMILGFEITAEDGKIYEFYQPVISYYSRSYSVKDRTGSKTSTAETKMTSPYATSWLLTGIKGPDYIDRTGNGYSADDFGFWVKIRYKNYGLAPWRTPYQDATNTSYDQAPDPLSSNTETMSEGIRDAVYLESIETATHIAFFSKSARTDDNPSSLDQIEIGALKWWGDSPSLNVYFPFDKNKFNLSNLSNVTVNAYYSTANVTYKAMDVYHGRYATHTRPFRYTQNVTTNLDNQVDNLTDESYTFTIAGISNGSDVSVNSNVPVANIGLSKGNYSLPYKYWPDMEAFDDQVYIYNYNGVIQSVSLSVPSQAFPATSKKLDNIVIKKKTLNADGTTNYDVSLASETSEGVRFDHDYRLCKGAQGSPSGTGKLTLTSVQKLGRGGNTYMPSTDFTYSNNPDYNQYSWDVWNGYTSEGTRTNHLNSMIKTVADHDASAWALSQMHAPLGGTINIEYESDYISKIGGDTQNRLSLFTPCFYQSWGEGRQPNGNASYMYIGDGYVDPITKGVNVFKAIFDDYKNTYQQNMPCAVSYLMEDGTGTFYNEVGQQNAVNVVNYTSTGTITFNYQKINDNISINTLMLTLDRSLPFKTNGTNDRLYSFYTLSNLYDPYDGSLVINAGVSTYAYQYDFCVSPNFMYGGGHRIKSVSITNGSDVKKTVYKYGTGYLNIMPSMAYAQMDEYMRLGWFTSTDGNNETYPFLDVLVNRRYNIIGPSPTVGYNKVEVYDVDASGNVLNGKTTTEFYTAEDYPFALGSDVTKKSVVETDDSHIKIDDKTGMQGRIKCVTVYGQKSGTTGAQESDFYPLQKTETDYRFSSQLSSSSEGRGVILSDATGTVDYLSSQPSNTAPLGLTQQKYESHVEGTTAFKYIDHQKENIYISGLTSTFYFYPNISNGDYTTVTQLGGTTKNLGFDERTGGTLVTQVVDSKGLRHVSETIPAYRYYNSLIDKNMLTQQVGNKGYSITTSEPSNFLALRSANSHNQYLTSASITTWKDWGTDGATGIWRQHDSYQWVGGQGYYEDFDKSPHQSRWTDTDPGSIILDVTGNSKIWQRTSNIIKYDRYGHPTEELGIDKVYVSSIYGYNDALPIAIVTGAKSYPKDHNGDGVMDAGNEASFIGFESGDLNASKDNDYWGIYSSPNNSFVEDAHTGKYGCRLSPRSGTDPTFGPTRDFVPDDQTRKYVLSCWAKTEDGFNNINGNAYLRAQGYADAQINPTNGKWVYIQIVIDIPAKAATLGGSALARCYPCNYNTSKSIIVDDIRFRPIDAQMSTYTYDPLTWKLTSITDKNNITSYYEYDAAGRLSLVRDQDKNIVKRNTYHYDRQ
jgi:YD repeat-containing protein